MYILFFTYFNVKHAFREQVPMKYCFLILVIISSVNCGKNIINYRQNIFHILW